jgi:hypothetical protein
MTYFNGHAKLMSAFTRASMVAIEMKTFFLQESRGQNGI